jgi:hypothetical protein
MKCKNKMTTLKTKRNEETEAGKGLTSTFFLDAGDDLRKLGPAHWLPTMQCEVLLTTNDKSQVSLGRFI